MTTTDTTTATMRAIVRDTYGNADVLRMDNVARPEATDHEVVLRVHAAGLDRGTWHMMTGQPYLGRLAFGLPKPTNPVLGIDVSGTVVAVGSAVTRFALGDEVFGFGKGTFAEYAVAREDRLARKPVNLSFPQAAVVPISAATALQALDAVGGIRSGHVALVIGASGGVGSYAVQLAKAFGAEVSGVASTAKLDLVRSLGADHVLDYTREDFTKGAQHYDLILDNVGTHSLREYKRVLDPKGIYVMIGSTTIGNWFAWLVTPIEGLMLSPFVSQKFGMFVADLNKEDLATLGDLMQSGKVTPVIDRRYKLSETPEALRYLEKGHARGKVVLTVE